MSSGDAARPAEQYPPRPPSSMCESVDMYALTIAGTEDNHHNGNDNDNDTLGGVGSRKGTLGRAMRRLLTVLRTWATIVRRSVPLAAALSVLLWLFYLPGLILDADQVQAMEPWYFDSLRYGLFQTSLYGVMVVCYVEIFSMQFARTAILCIGLPAYAFGLLFIADFMDGLLWLTVKLLVDLAAPFAMLLVIRASRAPHVMTRRQRDYFGLTKDGTPAALMKGLCGFFFAIMLFSYSLQPYLDASFTTQFVIRVGVMPVIVFSVNFFQHATLVGLSLRHMEKRLLVVVCTSQILHFLCRLMVSNVSYGASMSNYLVINAGMTAIDVGSRATFIHRYRLYARLKHWATSQWSRWVACFPSPQDTPVVPITVSASSARRYSFHPDDLQAAGADLSPTPVADPEDGAYDPTNMDGPSKLDSDSVPATTSTGKDAAIQGLQPFDAIPNIVPSHRHVKVVYHPSPEPKSDGDARHPLDLGTGVMDAHNPIQHVAEQSPVAIDTSSPEVRHQSQQHAQLPDRDGDLQPQEDIISPYTRRVRAKHMIEEIGTEIRVMIFVPLLMYFLSPIYPRSRFRLLSNFSDAATQIFVQLAFEFLGDFLSFYLGIYYQDIPLHREVALWKDRGIKIKFLISLVCMFYLHSFVAGLSY